MSELGDLLEVAYKAAKQRMDEQGMILTSAAESAFDLDDVQVFVKVIRFDAALLDRDPYSGGLLGMGEV